MNEKQLHASGLGRKGEERRRQIQRLVLEAIAKKGIDRLILTGDVTGPECSVGSFARVYPGVGGLERAIEDALLYGHTSQPTSPAELSEAVRADRYYWWSVIQGEDGRGPRQVIAEAALSERLANWPLSYYQRALIVAWIRIALPYADPEPLADRLARHQPSSPDLPAGMTS